MRKAVGAQIDVANCIKDRLTVKKFDSILAKYEESEQQIKDRLDSIYKLKSTRTITMVD